MNNARPIRRALISVSDKTGIVEFAQALVERGVDILSTGGTARLLAEQGIAVTEVSDYTGFPEMMDGRVKTLHPKVHGGVLGRRGQDDDVMEKHGINLSIWLSLTYTHSQKPLLKKAVPLLMRLRTSTSVAQQWFALQRKTTKT